LELPGDDGLALISYTAAPGSTSQQALRFLASWAPAPDQVPTSESTSENHPA
jgi:hypothetical protein